MIQRIINSLFNRRKPDSAMMGSANQANRPSVIMFTMVYNHGSLFQRWVNHHQRLLGRECLLVVDHGSTDGSTRNLKGINRLNIPRGPLDEGQRADFINDLQKALLNYHDVVIHSDADEYLIPDPRKYRDLHEFLADHPQDIIRPVGIQLTHLRDRETNPLHPGKPLLGQRKYGFLFKAMCKPAVTRIPAGWYPGCHDCQMPSFVDEDLILVHAGHADFGTFFQRLSMMRKMQYTDRQLKFWSHHQRISDSEIERTFERFGNEAKEGSLQPFDFSAYARLVNEDLNSHDLTPNNRDIRSPAGTIPDWLIGSV